MQNTGWLILLSLVISQPANSAQWSAQPAVNASVTYDDNRFLTVDDKESAWSTSVDPRVRFGIAAENKGLFGFAGARFRRYLTDSDTQRNDDSGDVSLDFGANSFLSTELSTYRFSAFLNRNKTNDTQLTNDGVVDANSIDQNATRIIINFGPSWSRSLNELTSISLNYNHSSLRYTDKLPNSTLVESDTDVVAASLSRSINEYIAGIVNVSYSNFRPSTNLDSTTVSLTAGLSGSFTETLSGTFSVGRRKTTFDTRAQALTGFCIGADPGSRFPQCTGGLPIVTGTRNIDDEDENTGLTFDVSFNKQLEAGSLGLTASRIVTPNTTTSNNSNNSDSGVLNTTLISVFGNHRLSERLGARLGVNVTDREDITSSSSSSDSRRFISYSAGLNWQWFPDLQLSTNFTHRQNESTNGSDTASGNSISFALNYSLRGLNMSR